MLNNPTWVSFCQSFNAALPVDPQQYDPQDLLHKMKQGQFYNVGDTRQSYWETEEPRYLGTIEQIVA